MAVRAARLHEIGGVPQVDEIDAPQGGGLVRVSTAALNPIDISIANGRFYGGSPPTPYVIGSEVVGTAEDGRRVWVRGRQLMAEVVESGQAAMGLRRSRTASATGPRSAAASRA